MDNIILLEWDDYSLLRSKLDEYINKFLWEYWSENIMKIRLQSSHDISFVASELGNSSLFWDHRLFIIYDLVLLWKEDDTDNEFDWIKICEKLSISDSLIFFMPTFDKRKKWWKYIKENSILHSYSGVKIESRKQEKDDFRKQLTNELSKVYPDFSRSIPLIISRVWLDRSLLVNELSKLQIFSLSHFVTDESIWNIILSNQEDTIFSIIDSILAGSMHEARKALIDVIEGSSSDIYMLLGWIMTNLRNIVYSLVLYKNWFQSQQIQENLWIHPFILTKSLKYADFLPRILTVYSALIMKDIALKSGKWLSDNESDIIFSIERVLLMLKKDEKPYNTSRY